MNDSSQTGDPLVSILMPAYNCEKYIRQALDSVLAQTYQNWELLAADDASRDGTRKILDHYAARDKRIRTYHQDKNKGYLKTWNRLLFLAQGDYITFQDADDWSAPERLETLLRALQEHPEVGAVGSNYQKVSADGTVQYTSQLETSPEAIHTLMPERFDFVGSGLLIRRVVCDTIGGYDEIFDRIGSEDLYWGYRISEAFGLMNVPEVLYYYRTNPQSVAVTLTERPGKWISLDLARYFIEQRKASGTDDLEAGRRTEALKVREDFEKPFREEPPLLYEKVALRRYYEGHKKTGRRLMWKAWTMNPLKLYRLKHWFFLLRH